jgi:TetR/AcrR family transcriptional regulator
MIPHAAQAASTDTIGHHTIRMSGVDRRRQIIRVAIELFSKRGFRGTTTKQIAEAAGISEAIIFRHFAKKQDLYTAILDDKWKEASEGPWMEELRDLAERREDELLFRSIASWFLESHRKDPSFHRLLLYSGLEGHEFSKILHGRGLPFRAFLHDYVVKRQKEGAFRKCDPGLLIFSLVAMPAHFGMLTKVFGFDLLPVSDEKAVDAFSKIMLDGIRVPKDKAKSKS